jgi:hypothetical protein
MQQEKGIHTKRRCNFDLEGIKEKRACMNTITATEESDGERRHQACDAAAAAAAAPPCRTTGGRETEEGIKLVESPARAFPRIVVASAGCVSVGVPLLYLAAMLERRQKEAKRRRVVQEKKAASRCGDGAE